MNISYAVKLIALLSYKNIDERLKRLKVRMDKNMGTSQASENGKLNFIIVCINFKITLTIDILFLEVKS